MIIIFIIIFIFIIIIMSIVLQNCIEQPFDTQVVGVARNGDFAEEFLYNIRLIFQSLDTRMSMFIYIILIMHHWHSCSILRVYD